MGIGLYFTVSIVHLRWCGVFWYVHEEIKVNYKSPRCSSYTPNWRCSIEYRDDGPSGLSGVIRDIHEEVHVYVEVSGFTEDANNWLWRILRVHEEVQMDPKVPGLPDHTPDRRVRVDNLSCYGPGLSGMLGDVQEDVEMDPPPRRLADGGSDWCWFVHGLIRDVQEKVHSHVEIPGLPQHRLKRMVPVNLLNDNTAVIAWMVRDIHEEVEFDPESPGIPVDSPDGASVGCGSGNVKKFIVLVEFLPDGAQVGLQKVDFILEM